MIQHDTYLGTRHSADDAETALRRILRSAPQDLWLDTLRRANLGRHADLIHWMLNRTECDFAVAALAFYRSNPIRHLTDPAPLPQRPDTAQIFALVLRNWDTGFYRTHQLQLTEGDIDPRLIRRVSQKLMAWPRGALPFAVPQPLLNPTGGQPVTLPPHLHPDKAAPLWQTFKALGLRVSDTAPGMPRRLAKARKVLNRISFRSSR